MDILKGLQPELGSVVIFQVPHWCSRGAGGSSTGPHHSQQGCRARHNCYRLAGHSRSPNADVTYAPVLVGTGGPLAGGRAGSWWPGAEQSGQKHRWLLSQL